MFSIIASLGTFALMSLTLDQLFEPHFWVVAGVAIAYAQKVVRGEVRTWQGEVQEGG